MRNRPYLFIFWMWVLSLSMAMIGCGGGGGGQTNGAGSPANSTLTAESSGKAELPQGSGFGSSDLNIWTSVNDPPVPVSGAGDFKVTVWKDGTQLAVAFSPAGEPLLLGFLSPNIKTLSARSTAEVLVYFALGGYGLPFEGRNYLLQELPNRPEVDELENAIKSALQAPIGAATLETPEVKAALASVRTNLLATSQKTRWSLLIEPAGSKSGITLDQQGLNEILLTNAYRRRAVAFVERTGFTPNGGAEGSGGCATPERETFKKIDLSPVTSFTSLFGAFGDIVRGDMAYAPVSASPLLLPMNPSDAAATCYRVTALGAGFHPSEAALTDEETKALLLTIAQTVIVDYTIPLLANTILDIGGKKIDEQLNFALAAAVSQDVVTFIGSKVPGVLEKMMSGDILGAVNDIGEAVIQGNAIRPLIMGMITDHFFPNNKPGEGVNWEGIEAFERGGKVLSLISKIDAGLTVIDSAVQVEQVKNSRLAVAWDVRVNKSRVKISPNNAQVAPTTRETFTAKVVDADENTSRNIVYRWSTTGQFGALYDSQNRLQTGPFDTLTPTAFYVSNSAEGDDTITVEAFLTAAGTTNRQSLGTDTAKVSVKQKKITLVPVRSSLLRGEEIQLIAQVPPDQRPTGAILFYEWSTTGNFGNFTGGVTSLETQDTNHVVYRSKSEQEGADTVTVEVFRDSVSLGKAAATVKTEVKKSIIFGRIFVESAPLADNRKCSFVYLGFGKVEGATRYSLHAYNFFDPLFWGDHVDASFTPEETLPVHVPCDEHPRQNNGSEFIYMLTGGSGPASSPDADTSRFEGIIVEVTVTY